MRFMIIVPVGKESESGAAPTTKDFADMTTYNEQLAQAGVMLAGEGLQPASQGVRVKFENAKQTVINGPLTVDEHHIAGFWIIQAESRDKAIEWVKKAPFSGGVEIEIRQIAEADDFGDAMTPELKQREQKLQRRVRENAKQPA